MFNDFLKEVKKAVTHKTIRKQRRKKKKTPQEIYLEEMEKKK